MQAELTAASRHEHVVLYDPAAIPGDTPVDPDLQAQDPKLLPEPAMRQLALLGQALVLRIRGGDCEARFRLFVNEEPPEQVRSRGQLLVAGARLRVPSGLLRADGLEFLCRPGERRLHSEPEDATVPSGVYALEMHSLLSWKAATRIAEGRRGMGRMQKAVHVLVATYTWLGILMFPANLLVAPFVVASLWRSGGWRGAATAVAVILTVDAVVLAGFWLLEAARRRIPRLFRVADADAAFEIANPDVVVMLQASDDDGSPHAAAFAEARVAG
jgi:hypothetical protein